MFVLAIIPARGGSKAIKNKNIIKINKKPLIQYTFDEAKKSKYINEIYVTSDSKKIINIAIKNNINFVRRPKKISGDNSKTIEAIKHLIKYFKKKNNFYPNYIVILQPTSPLRKFNHIDKALQKIINDSKADSLVSCVKIKHNFNPDSLMKINKKGYLVFKKNIKRRQDKMTYYARNGAAIYIIKYPVYLKSIFGDRTLPFIMDEKLSLDIDDEIDLKKFRKIFNDS